MGSETAEVRIPWEETDGEPPKPVVRRTPYAEVKLEHPGLEATMFGSGFFPDAVPYTFGTEERVFYWRPSVVDDPPPPTSWSGVCSTTHRLRPTDDGSVRPRPWEERDDGTEVVVDGTVAGDSTTVTLRGYTTSEVLVSFDHGSVRVEAGGKTYTVSRGDRNETDLPTQSGVRIADSGDGESEVTPRLTVRFPGERTVYHPAVDSGSAIFPSFGIGISDIPHPVPVPTENGELNHRALASVLGVDLSDRPYPERVLWQAFAHTVFGTRRETEARLGVSEGLFVVVNPE